MTEQNTRRVASPEWVVAGRSDISVDEALRGGWGVSPAPLVRSASFVNFANREMSVPTGDSPADHAVRTHELIHARVSPTAVPNQLMEQIGVTPSSVRLAEEVRVNFLAGSLRMRHSGHPGVRALTDGSEKGIAEKAVKDKNWLVALNLYLTTFNTDIHKTVKRKLRTIPEWKSAFTLIDSSLDSWNTTGKNPMYAERVRRTDVVTYHWVDGRFGQVETAQMGSGFMNFTLPLAGKIDEWIANPPAPATPKGEGRFGIGSRLRSNPRRNEWEELRFGMTSLTEATTSFLGKRKRPAMVGKFPVRPDRLLTDPERRIFREVVRAEGGIVVFDCSGSMSVSHDDVREVMTKYAGATVMAYTYRGENTANAWVLARNNRMVSESEFKEIPLGHGNGVDGPALRWAIRQRRSPKDFIVWVTDGAVTGKGDGYADNLLLECANLSVRHNIVSVEDVDEAVQLLAEMKRTGKRFRHRFIDVISEVVMTKGFNHEL